VIFCIAQFLPLKSLLKLEQTCKRISRICNSPMLYSHYLEKCMIKKEEPNSACKKDLIDFMNGKMPLYSPDKLCNNRLLHVFVAKIIGIDNFMDLPILDLGNRRGSTDYIDFVTNEDMNAPLMKGIDCFTRPFIAIRYINRERNTFSTVVIFHRYTDEGSLAIGCCYPGSCFPHSRIRNSDMLYLERLLLHKPCGAHNPIDSEIEEIKFLPDGRSIVEIC